MTEKKLIPVSPAKVQTRVVRAIANLLRSAACIDVEDTGERVFLYFNYVWKVDYVRRAASYLVGLYREHGPRPVFESDDASMENSETPMSLRDFLAANIETVMMFYEEESEGGKPSDTQGEEMPPTLVSFLSENSIPWPRFFHTEGLSDAYKVPSPGAANGIRQDGGKLFFRNLSRGDDEDKKLSEIARSFFSSVKKQPARDNGTKSSPSLDAADGEEDGEGVKDRRTRE